MERQDMGDCWQKVAQLKVERRGIKDSFYAEGNKLCASVLGKKPVIVFDDEGLLHQPY